MRRLLLALAAALMLGGCGSDDPPRGPAKQPSAQKIESFAHIQLPASARDIKAKSEASMDESLHASFVIDRDDVDGLVKSAGFASPLEKGYKPYAFTEFGWHLDQIRDALGGKDDKPGFGRELVIDLDTPDIAKVYLVASET
jgi:hypothetical protein